MKSAIDIYDFGTGRATTLFETDAHIEAPNWSRDGRHLLVNGGGRLFRVSLTAPRLDLVETGSLTALNNDHGLSPDGDMLAVSNKTNGASCIYILPSHGGEAHRVTERTPSWWHGWSPCGERLAYTAVRDGDFCIATCALDGSDERILIGGPHHYDGPDHTPDGEWIWFNSDRGGAMRLWRVRPDATDAEEMTAGETVDWFPHPSPDGRHIVYLAYPPGTEGHPPDLDVELRRLDPVTRQTETLVRLFGGQGTINVPSWAPDSRRFAYVRYARP